jgi:hypothetical protein
MGETEKPHVRVVVLPQKRVLYEQTSPDKASYRITKSPGSCYKDAHQRGFSLRLFQEKAP